MKTDEMMKNVLIYQHEDNVQVFIEVTYLIF